MKKLITVIKSLDKGTLIRCSLLILSYINQIVAIIGMTSYASSTWYQIVSMVCTILISAVTAWKNNDFTHFAQLSGKVLNALRDNTLSESEIEELLQKSRENINP